VARILKDRKSHALDIQSAKRQKRRKRAKPKEPSKPAEAEPPKGRDQRSPELVSSLKARIRLARKYSGCNIKDFHGFYDVQKKFLFDHNLSYREDSHLRNKVMKGISDTANTYMRIRKALGLRDYDWTDNPHFFLHVGLSRHMWRKAIKWLVKEALKAPSGVT